MEELQSNSSSLAWPRPLGSYWCIKRKGEESYETTLPSVSLNGPVKGLKSSDYDYPEDHVVVHANLHDKYRRKYRNDVLLMDGYRKTVPLRTLSEEWLVKALREAYQIESEQKRKTPREALFEGKMAFVRQVCVGFANTLGLDVREEGLSLHIGGIMFVELVEGWGDTVSWGGTLKHDHVDIAWRGAQWFEGEKIKFQDLSEKRLANELSKVYSGRRKSIERDRKIMERYR